MRVNYRGVIETESYTTGRHIHTHTHKNKPAPKSSQLVLDLNGDETDLLVICQKLGSVCVFRSTRVRSRLFTEFARAIQQPPHKRLCAAAAAAAVI